MNVLVQTEVAESHIPSRPIPFPCYPHSSNTSQKAQFTKITLYIRPHLTEMRSTLFAFDLRKPKHSVRYRCVCISLLFRDHTPRPPAHRRSRNVHVILHKHHTFWPALLSNDTTSISHKAKLSQVRQHKNFEDEITDMEEEMRKLEHCYYSATVYHCTSGTVRHIHISTRSLTTTIL